MRNPTSRQLFILLSVSIPICIFYAFIWHFAVSVPFQDDFDGILEVIKKITGTHVLSEKAGVFFLQDDEHRVLFDRIITYSLFAINGEVNLKYQLFIGCLLILGIFGLVAHAFVQAKLPLWGLIPVSLLLFQIQYHEGIFWSMIPCQNFAVLFFAVLSIFLVAQNTTPTLLFALFSTFLGAFSSGNGIVMLVPCLLILIYQRRYVASGLWLGWMLTCLYGYFHNLVVPSFRPKLSDNILKYPLNILADFPAFMGQIFDPGTHFSPTVRGLFTIPVGILLIVWVLFLVWKLVFNTNYKTQDASHKSLVFWVGVLLFITATAFLFSIARAGDGFEAVFRSRYKLTLALALVLCYCTLFLLVQKKWQKLVFAIGLGLGLSINALSYFQLSADVINFRRSLIADMFSWKYGQNLPTSPIYFARKAAVDSIIQHSLDNRYYQIPESVITPIETKLTGSQVIMSSKNIIKLKISTANGYVTFGNDEFAQGSQRDDGAYIVLKSDRETHLFPAQQHRSSLRRFVTSGRYFNTGFDTAPILKKGLSIGLYQVYLVAVNNHQPEIYPTNATVLVEDSFKSF